MRIKRFLAPDMRQALRLVREDQGPDAVVVSSRRTETGIELLVALEYDEQLVSAMSASAPVASVAEAGAGSGADGGVESRSDSVGTGALPENGPIIQGSGADPLGSMGNELRRLRAALEQQLCLLGAREGGQDTGELMAYAERLGLERSTLRELAAEARNKGYPQERLLQGVRTLLRERVKSLEGDIVDQGGVLSLIGPTGVGKTTTVAKLAARFALKFGRRHVALITTDTFRIGAREQLLTFGEVLGIPVDSAANRDELAQLLQQHARKRLILIDNAGLSQRDLRLAAQLSSLDCIPFIKTYLVVSSVTHKAGLDEVFRAFGRARLQGCIVTKLDEAATLGPMLDALAHNQIPLAYACDGQRVPEDIHPALAMDLLERAETLADTMSAPVTTAEDIPQYRTANGLH